MRIFYFAGGATGTSSRKNAGGKATWGEPGREAQEPRLGGLWGLQQAPLEALVPHAISRAGQVFICFIDLTPNTLFLPLPVSNLKLKQFHYFYIFQF